jgi:hypothetical protein
LRGNARSRLTCRIACAFFARAPGGALDHARRKQLRRRKRRSDDFVPAEFWAAAFFSFRIDESLHGPNAFQEILVEPSTSKVFQLKRAGARAGLHIEFV